MLKMLVTGYRHQSDKLLRPGLTVRPCGPDNPAGVIPPESSEQLCLSCLNEHQKQRQELILTS